MSSAEKMEGIYRKASEIPSTGKDWVTLDSGIEFQAAPDADPRIEHVRKLWRSNKDNETPPMFLDGTETYYDENAQAWRLLGFYVDCDACGGDENYNPAECAQLDDDESTCQRFLLWAAVR